jgi:hypothetical protein
MFLLVILNYIGDVFIVKITVENEEILLKNKFSKSALKKYPISEIAHIYIRQTFYQRLFNSCVLIFERQDANYPQYPPLSVINQLLSYYQHGGHVGNYLISVVYLDLKETKEFTDKLLLQYPKLPKPEYSTRVRTIFGLKSNRI